MRRLITAIAHKSQIAVKLIFKIINKHMQVRHACFDTKMTYQKDTITKYVLYILTSFFIYVKKFKIQFGIFVQEFRSVLGLLDLVQKKFTF